MNNLSPVSKTVLTIIVLVLAFWALWSFTHSHGGHDSGSPTDDNAPLCYNCGP